MKKNKKLKFTLKVLVSAGFATWIIFAVDWKEVWHYLTEIKIWGIFAYIIVLLIGFYISSRKWKFLANFKGINLPIGDFFKLYITGVFINNFMPSFLAGDAYKAYAIGKKDERYIVATSTILVDRVTGYAGATILAVIFGLLNFHVLWENKILLFINLGLLAFLASDFAIIIAKKIPFLRRIVIRILPQKIIELLKELATYNSGTGIIKKATFYAIIFSLIGVALLNYILFLSLGIRINPLDYLTVIFITTIISALPISINNIGLKEWSYITFFGFFGIGASAVVTVAIVSRFLQMLVSFAALPLYLKERK